MSKKRGTNLLKHFLKDSPKGEISKFNKVFEQPLVVSRPSVVPISNRIYLNNFMRSLQVYGPPAYHQVAPPDGNQVSPKKILRQELVKPRSSDGSQNQIDQLRDCIKQITRSSISITGYQQIEQRLVIASPDIISTASVNLKYLFKILLNRRDKLSPQSLELQANLHLSQAIINAFARDPQHVQNSKHMNKLEAMEKLFRAREYKKKGFHLIATDSFVQVFRDEAAAYQTRLEALKILCLEGEEQGDVSRLEHLVSLTHEKGEKQYEEYLLLMIEKIKKIAESKASSK